MEDTPFYATLKLVTSEEILSEVMAQEEEDTQFFILSNPIIVVENNQVDVEKGIVLSGLVPRKWMLYSNEDLTIVYKQHVVAVSEMDKFGVDFYKKALIAAKCSSPIKKKVETEKNTGFIGKIDNMRKKLEDKYNNSPDLTSE
tara:strand:- start:128 stop:556 length:429 start_codon:yes stop_codon:yes gene_type:complete